jgi:gamma-glutamyltranspeptidase / glutathione hydrolase
MTDRWLNYVLGVVVVVGLIAATLHERPRLAEERAELLDQEVVTGGELEDAPEDRDPVELRLRDQQEGEELAAPEAGDDPDEADEEADDEPALGAYGVTSSHPEAVQVGMDVLEAGGNATDAAVAVAYALGVVEPFGSGPGGGGSLVLHPSGGEPVAYDYRETVPASGETPASDIGVPGFVAGMEHVHREHGSIELPDLIEPAARLAEDGIEVSDYLNDRLRAAAARLPIHLAPRFFPDGAAIGVGETLRQPEYAEALRAIQEGGAEVMHGGELGQEVAETVSGIELSDLEDYEVMEVEPAIGSFRDHDVIGGGAPTSGPTVVQILQIAEALGVRDMEPGSADAHHAIAQAWRLALNDRTELIGDPSVEDIPLPEIIERDHTDQLAELVPDDAFAPVEDGEPAISPETDTTHIVVVDRDGTMVSMTNTLSNFFGSGLPVSGFFMNDQLKNFAPDPESVNHPAPNKRPRSFIAPMILARDGDPVMGIGSPGGRRIPMVTAQVLINYASHGQDLETSVAEPRFHLEGQLMQTEEQLPDEVVSDLNGRGYEVTTEIPVTEYYGGMQALQIDHDAGEVDGIADERRPGDWAAGQD